MYNCNTNKTISISQESSSDQEREKKEEMLKSDGQSLSEVTRSEWSQVRLERLQCAWLGEGVACTSLK